LRDLVEPQVHKDYLEGLELRVFRARRVLRAIKELRVHLALQATQALQVP